LAAEVIGIGRRQLSLDKAIDCGAVDRTTMDLKAGVAGAEMVVVATPVGSVPGLVREIAAICPAGGLITDVGSVKGAICRELASVRSFVGSHPLAGDHRYGPENARGDLLAGKVVVVTPPPAEQAADQAGPSGQVVVSQQAGLERQPGRREKNRQERGGTNSACQQPFGLVPRVSRFWESLGARVVQLEPEVHDQALAATSHLPHWVASALAAATPEQWLPLVATGWRDTTRIAAADPNLWEQIFTENKAGLLESLDRFLERIERMRNALAAEKQLPTLLDEAKRIRDAVGD